jgi:putative endonuclease
MFFVYLLLLKNNKIYTGYTDNLRRRIKEHKDGKVKSTKNLKPLKLIFCEIFLNKKDAQRREKYFKTTKGKKMIKILLKEYFKNLAARSSSG